MKNTKIQWCHSTVNPVMGCDGCELWPGPAAIAAELAAKLAAQIGERMDLVRARVNRAIGGQPLSVLYAERDRLAKEVARGRPEALQAVVVEVVRRRAKCYAGLLSTMRQWHLSSGNPQSNAVKRGDSTLTVAAADSGELTYPRTPPQQHPVRTARGFWRLGVR